MESALRKLQDRIQSNFNLKKSGGGARFFGGAKRGEGVELASMLNSTDKERQKNALKRIIANMTLGRDVSQLFTDVVKLGQTFNIELKKLVYLYVLNTAKLQPEKALMAVNTFLQDAHHQSPIIRALALRTMMCIRVDCVMEYTLEPLRRAVTDSDPYVRKTAAVGLGKLFHQSPRVFMEQNLLDDLIKMLNDHFPFVSSNAAAVLSEVNAHSSSSRAVSQEVADRLMTALPECSEWGQTYIMELLAGFIPKSTSDADTLIDRILPRLSHTNASVIMAAIKVVTCQASRCSDAKRASCLPRINSALLTLSKSEPETQFIVFRNIHMLLALFPGLLAHNIDAFYIRFSDPPYVKIEKLKLMLKLLRHENAHALVKELREYGTEVDVGFMREVVGAIATAAIKEESVAPTCSRLLTDLVGKRPELLPYVINATKNIVRKYPELLTLDELIAQHGADQVVEEEARVSFVWMLGEFCDHVENGPQILEAHLRDFLILEPSVQLALLTAVVKVFLRNPVNMEPTLNTILDLATTKCQNPDLRDRAFGYWRLLSKGIGVEKMKVIVHGRKPPVDVDRTFSEAMTIGEMRFSLNTASAVYGRPSRNFVPTYGVTGEDEGSDDEDDLMFGEAQTNVAQATVEGTAAAPRAAGGAEVQHVDPLDDIFNGPQPTTAAAETAHSGAAWGQAKQSNPAPTKPAMDDPFGDLGPVSSPEQPTGKVAAPVPTQSQTAPAASALDDIFGGGAVAPAGPQNPPPAPPSNTAAPQLPQVLDASQGLGLGVCAAISMADEHPRLLLELLNRTHPPVAISDFALQINVNSFGFYPAKQLSELVSSVSVGENKRIGVPLSVSDSHINASRFSLEVGVKCSQGLFRFTVAPKIGEFLLPARAVDRADFIPSWNGMDASCEAKQLLRHAVATAASKADGAAIIDVLRQNHIHVVHQRHEESQEAYLASCKTHLGIRVLLMVVVSRKNPMESYVNCKSLRVNDVLPVVHHVVEETLALLTPTMTSSVTGGNDDFFF